MDGCIGRPRLRTRIVVALAAVATLGVAAAPVAATPPSDDPAPPGEPAPLLGVDDPAAIADHFVVVFREGATAASRLAADDVRAQGGVVHDAYDAVLEGFAASLPADALNDLRQNPDVEYIEADKIVRAQDDQLSPPSFGLDRIDQRDLPLDDRYHYDANGAGVTAYILDSGIRFTHQEFGGRASSGFDAVGDGQNGNDCNGHGTHTAGTVGGRDYGVAKSVTLLAVRVLGCQGTGSESNVITGIDWITANSAGPAVALAAIGGAGSVALDQAVQNSIDAGITYVTPAGNFNDDACNYSPGRVPGVITVGATSTADARSSFSNHGACIDLFAPGETITSAWNSSDTATNTLRGTSMAAAHAVGAAALYLQSSPSTTPAEVQQRLVDTATNGKVTDPGVGSPNKLLYTLGGSVPPPPPPAVPGAPTNVSAAPGDRQATVSFGPPASDGGSAILDYTSSCVPAGGGDTLLTNTGPSSPITVSGLTNGVTWSCTVHARNAVGDGPESAAASVTPNGTSPPTAPGAPRDVSVTAGNQQATVFFAKPLSNGGSGILDYTATCGSNSNTGTGSPLVVTGLANGVTVGCSVTARNSVGTGPASSPPVFVRPATVPGAPRNVAATPGNGQATVTFYKPLSNGGSGILDYTATCGSKSKTGAGSPLVVTGLTNGVTVGCTVTARNSVGTGPASSPAVLVRPATVPGVPRNVAAAAGNSQATVTFYKPLSNGGSGILDYTATCGSKSKTGAGSPLVVTGLSNGVTVNCTVRARNAIGSGPASSPISVKPKP